MFEGYGLSECGSVVCLEYGRGAPPGSVGQPLRHVRIRVDDDGHIMVVGRDVSGLSWRRTPRRDGEECATGDLGDLDAGGFLYVPGRQRNLFITAYGRNVAPEWVEAALLAQPEIAQAVVFGEARPAERRCGRRARRDVEQVGQRGRPRQRHPAGLRQSSPWLPGAPFTPANGLATGNGRPIRAAILQQHAHALESLYSAKESSHAVL